MHDSHVTSARRGVDAFRVFAFLWAVSILFHLVSTSEPVRPHQVLIVAAAFLVIYRPLSVPAFLSLVALHVVYVLRRLPYGSNHTLFAAGVDLTMLTAALLLAVQARRLRVDRDE